MKSYTFSVVIIVLMLSIIGCSCGGSVLKGTIVMRTETESYINLGYDDGIKLGGTLSIWRDQSVGKTIGNVSVGKVRVIKILDKNHAAVEALKGNLNEQDIVEKRNP